jgi:UDP-N-acetylmuramyl pentapeptide synthase
MKRIFKKDINNNDVVMIKGSNATGLFKISQNLKKRRINAI